MFIAYDSPGRSSIRPRLAVLPAGTIGPARRPATRRVNAARLRTALAVCLLVAPGVSAAAGAVEGRGIAGLTIAGMTFVQSDGETAAMVVEAERGRLDPQTNIVHLETVKTRVSGNAERSGFELTCDEGELTLGDHALLATGNVRGKTADGRTFVAPWVRYDPRKEIAYTDAPVEIEEANGSLHGGGFRYHVREGRFRLLGGATVRREN